MSVFRISDQKPYIILDGLEIRVPAGVHNDESEMRILSSRNEEINVVITNCVFTEVRENIWEKIYRKLFLKQKSTSINALYGIISK